MFLNVVAAIVTLIVCLLFGWWFSFATDWRSVRVITQRDKHWLSQKPLYPHKLILEHGDYLLYFPHLVSPITINDREIGIVGSNIGIIIQTGLNDEEFLPEVLERPQLIKKTYVCPGPIKILFPSEPETYIYRPVPEIKIDDLFTEWLSTNSQSSGNFVKIL
jgi:hypothetical protein